MRPIPFAADQRTTVSCIALPIMSISNPQQSNGRLTMKLEQITNQPKRPGKRNRLLFFHLVLLFFLLFFGPSSSSIIPVQFFLIKKVIWNYKPNNEPRALGSNRTSETQFCHLTSFSYNYISQSAALNVNISTQMKYFQIYCNSRKSDTDTTKKD